jgi:hypothetical protein
MLTESIAHWTALAEAQDRSIAEGFAACPQAAKHKADLYRRTAQALQYEQDTGVPVCVCCLKPRGQKPTGKGWQGY